MDKNEKIQELRELLKSEPVGVSRETATIIKNHQPGHRKIRVSKPEYSYTRWDIENIKSGILRREIDALMDDKELAADTNGLRQRLADLMDMFSRMEVAWETDDEAELATESVWAYIEAGESLGWFEDED